MQENNILKKLGDFFFKSGDQLRDFDNVRERILHQVIKVLIWCSLPVVIASMWKQVPLGRWALCALYATLYLCLLIAAIFKSRIPFRRLAAGLLIALYIFSVLVLAVFGVSGAGLLLLLTFSVLTTSLLGLRRGLAALGASLAGIIVVGAGMTYGLIPIDVPTMANSTSGRTWVLVSCIFSLLALVMIYVFAKMLENLRHSLELGAVRAAELQESNRQLLAEIAERQRAEEALRRSENTLKSVLDAAPIGIGLVQNRIFRWTNQQMSVMTGYTGAELIGRSARMIYETQEEFKRVGAVMVKEIEQNGINSLETRWIRKDGKAIEIILSSSSLTPQHLSDQWVFTALDITEHKRAEEALRHSEERFRIAASLVSDLIYERDPVSGVIEFFGNKYEKLGYPLEEYPKTPKEFLELVHPDDVVIVLQGIQRQFETGEPFAANYRVRTRNGEYLHWVDRSVILMDPSGRPYKLIGATTDATERVRAEEEKARIEEQLRQSLKMEAIGRLAGGVAHDFNNILTGIRGYTEILLSALEKSDPLSADLEEIKKAADRAAELTNQLLAFSRKQIISPAVIDINEVILKSQKMLGRLIGEDLEFKFLPATDLGRVKVDPGQIEQILVNLVINARDAMPRGGRLSIETADVTSDPDRALHAEAQPGNWVMLAVSDNGCGMSKEVQQHLFEPFFTTKEKGKGTGLGLATIYGIVKQNGGFINFYSEEKIGTTFKIYLPRVEEEAVALEPPRLATLPTGSETVLLVEDEEMVRHLARKILERQGYRVLEAKNGGEALMFCDTYHDRIDLLLTDVIMPSMNGKELHQRLCAILPKLKVLFMSGYTEDVIVTQGVLEAGTRFIYKPFTIETLAHKVREALDG